jgi:glycyl-tRNA synthetase beta chain
MNSPALPLLVEIGCEEIPARFLTDAERQFGERLRDALREARLLPLGPESQPNGNGSVPNPQGRTPNRATTYSTPRRLVAHLSSLLANQPDLEEQVMGPPAKVAFDAAGKPTRAAESFAAKNSVKVEELLQLETPKGLYLAAKKTTPGRAAVEVLADVLPRVIRSVTLPKSMVWESAGVRFVRPIRWIVAVLGEGEHARTVPFELAGVASGNHTQGHRLAGAGPILVEGFADYAQKLRQHFVEFDPENRRQSTRSEVNVVLEPWQEAVPDRDLEEWVVNSTEWVAGLRGAFDPRYLELPREILVTVMRDHQKYFAVEDRDGKLQPSFVTLLNRDRDAKGVIRDGHERVLQARFSDAEFFWNADQKVPLARRFEEGWLERVTYQAKLGSEGSYAAKLSRMKQLSENICNVLEYQGRLAAGQRSHVLRAVELSKCDLTTQMVQEFTELQGVVGGLYARTQGESEEVAQAIYDHYRPVNIEDECPRSAVGAIVSLADKLDAVNAGFSVGLQPTGSSDPFGLRRAGNGIIKLYVEALPGLALDAGEELRNELREFYRERLDFYLQSSGLHYDTVRAVLSDQTSMGWQVPSDVLARGRALEVVRETADFKALAAAAKRTRNLLTKSAKAEDFGSAPEVNGGLLKASEERDLYAAYDAARSELTVLEANLDYAGAFRRLAKLRPAVDQFFDKVMVMDADLGLRANRLRLLADLDTLAFRRFADLSEIEAASGSGEANTA